MRLLTPPGIAGVAVVLVEPHDRRNLANLLRDDRGASVTTVPFAPPRRARLCLGREAIDDVLVVDRGAQGVEVHLHGSPAVLQMLPITSTAGELPRAAALELLRSAISRGQLRLAVEQMGHDFDRELLDASRLHPSSARRAIAAALRRSRTSMALSVPQRLVLVGRQNVGKSSLFNRLLFRERVLTGPLPGLTRDPVAEVTTLADYPYELIDTAGEGESEQGLDLRAIVRGREHQHAAIRVLVVDAASAPAEFERGLVRAGSFVVRNKSDVAIAASAGRSTGRLPAHVEVSAKDEGASTVRAVVGEALRRYRRLPVAGAVGGFAAIDAAQLQRMHACALQLGLEGDCGDGSRTA